MYASQATMQASADSPLKAHQGDPRKMASGLVFTKSGFIGEALARSADSRANLCVIVLVYFRPAAQSRGYLGTTGGFALQVSMTIKSEGWSRGSDEACLEGWADMVGPTLLKETKARSRLLLCPPLLSSTHSPVPSHCAGSRQIDLNYLEHRVVDLHAEDETHAGGRRVARGREDQLTGAAGRTNLVFAYEPFMWAYMTQKSWSKRMLLREHLSQKLDPYQDSSTAAQTVKTREISDLYYAIGQYKYPCACSLQPLHRKYASWCRKPSLLRFVPEWREEWAQFRTLGSQASILGLADYTLAGKSHPR
ncbi:hypothetical protein NM688_g774 [Phlebia brevispora]|uniref:Uncharacterized protein n=1 Tax=Phlebia brevispora TaxID=194682 RepID=A0ACC1TDP0_9APHY|nr:hypothetical protein NM688_g774 [Phlebia brevispora]